MTMTGIVEQMMAARPLGTNTSAHDTKPLPHVINKKPRKAWMRRTFQDGKLSFLTKNKKPESNIPAIICLIAANKNGGKCVTPMRITKKVVPQITQIPARQK